MFIFFFLFFLFFYFLSLSRLLFFFLPLLSFAFFYSFVYRFIYLFSIDIYLILILKVTILQPITCLYSHPFHSSIYLSIFIWVINVLLYHDPIFLLHPFVSSSMMLFHASLRHPNNIHQLFHFLLFSLFCASSTCCFVEDISVEFHFHELYFLQISLESWVLTQRHPFSYESLPISAFHSSLHYPLPPNHICVIPFIITWSLRSPILWHPETIFMAMRKTFS